MLGDMVLVRANRANVANSYKYFKSQTLKNGGKKWGNSVICYISESKVPLDNSV